jgi:hypothetical protein
LELLSFFLPTIHSNFLIIEVGVILLFPLSFVFFFPHSKVMDMQWLFRQLRKEWSMR